LTLRQELADRYGFLARPVVTRRYFPSVVLGDCDKPSIDELVMTAADDLIIVDGWSGDAQMTFPAVTGQDLHELSPVKMGSGYRFSASFSITGVVLLENSAQ